MNDYCTQILLGSLIALVLSACRVDTPPQWQWERAEAGLPRQAIVTTVAADPTGSDIVWAGIYARDGLATSRDGGQTWTVNAEGLGDNPVFDLLALPRPKGVQPAEVWAATRDGLLRSLDAGSRWEPVLAEIPAGTVFALAADGAGRLFVGHDGGGVYTRMPDGQGWQQLTPVEPLASAAVLSLAVSPDGRQIYVGTSGRGIFASADGGRTWQETYAGEYAPNVVLNPAKPMVAVASLRDRLVRTVDGGATWHTLKAVTWGWEEVVSLLWLADGTLAAGTGQSRLYISLDDGERWVERTSSLAAWGVIDLAIVGDPQAELRRLLAGTWAGVYGSLDGGQSWINVAPSLGAPYAQTLLSTERGLLLGTRSGLFRWEPDTMAWTIVASDTPISGINVLGNDPARPEVLFAGTSGNGLYRSLDAGLTWQQISSSAVGITALAVDPNNSDHLFMLAAWERAYESWDGGQTWLARWTGFGDTLETTSLVIEAGSGETPTVYVGAEWGLYRSQGNGAWKLVALDIVDQSILALMIRPVPPESGEDTALYIGATRGTYRSLDSGRTVQGCDTGQGWGCGLEDLSVTAFAADPVDPQQLFAGTAYAGVYHSTDRGHSWQPIGPADLAEDVVEALAWGPEGGLFVAAAGGVWRGVRP